MANKKNKETAPEQEGAVLNQEVETETVIEEVIKDALDATNDAKTVTEAEAEAKAKTEAEAQAKAEADAKAKAEADAKAKANEGVFEHKGLLYQFVEDTPEKLSLDEGLFTKAEILSNKELMQSLIETNCIFIKQV